MSIGALVLLVILLFVAVAVAVAQRSQNRVRQLRDVGMYPQPGAEADHDVDRSFSMVTRSRRSKCTALCTGLDSKEAKDAVEQRQRTLGLR